MRSSGERLPGLEASLRVLSEPYPWRKDQIATLVRQSGEARRAMAQRRLVAAVRYAGNAIPFYRDLWAHFGVEPELVGGIEDLTLLPTCGLDDVRAAIERKPPFGDQWDLARGDEVGTILSTGGTSGIARPVLLATNDQRRVAEVAARKWVLREIGPEDIVQVTWTYSTHGAAWVASWSLELVEATVLPTSSGNTTPSRRQVELMNLVGSTVLFATPSYARVLADAAADSGIDPKSLQVRKILTAGELMTSDYRAELEDLWAAALYDCYGTMETLVWMAEECEASREAGGALGMHIWDDAIIVEILDENGRPCADGEYGELTLTSWVNSVGPKIRFRMGDIAAVTYKPCACGLPTPRLLPLAGRMDDRVRIRGVNIWPADLERLARMFPGGGEYVMLIEDVGSTDHCVLQLETDLINNETASVLAETISAESKSILGVSVDVQLCPIGSTANTTGVAVGRKAKRVIDLRNRKR